MAFNPSSTLTTPLKLFLLAPCTVQLCLQTQWVLNRIPTLGTLLYLPGNPERVAFAIFPVPFQHLQSSNIPLLPAGRNYFIFYYYYSFYLADFSATQSSLSLRLPVLHHGNFNSTHYKKITKWQCMGMDSSRSPYTSSLPSQEFCLYCNLNREGPWQG